MFLLLLLHLSTSRKFYILSSSHLSFFPSNECLFSSNQHHLAPYHWSSSASPAAQRLFSMLSHACGLPNCVGGRLPLLQACQSGTGNGAHLFGWSSTARGAPILTIFNGNVRERERERESKRRRKKKRRREKEEKTQKRPMIRRGPEERR